MKTDLDELERYWMYHRQSQTWSGRIRCLIDIAFASYCVYKLGMTTWNMLVGRIGNGDPITNLLSWMVAKSNVNIDPAFWSQQLSFWFAGMIVFGSVRGFFKLVSKVLGHFSQAITLHSDQVLLFTAHLMGLYFLSSVVMMQLNLPSDYRYLLASSLEHIEFTFFQRWADTIGVVSSAITIVVLYVLQRTKDMHGLAQDYAGIELDAVEAGH
ncbi:Abscisic acid G-protein coupled receptor-like domain-containing protein [Gongronella butleri]|nr:Abscisic acid G-protein coupled receptor-like domain-containing protein [Gongronella butleri]